MPVRSIWGARAGPDDAASNLQMTQWGPVMPAVRTSSVHLRAGLKEITMSFRAVSDLRHVRSRMWNPLWLLTNPFGRQ
jgi:hypothetical protein